MKEREKRESCLRESQRCDVCDINPGDLCLISTQFVDTEPFIEFIITSDLAIDLYVDHVRLSRYPYSVADITKFQIEIA
jgi:hypothetical protein